MREQPYCDKGVELLHATSIDQTTVRLASWINIVIIPIPDIFHTIIYTTIVTTSLDNN